ncbi:VOC family protein [uncultured Rhodoblastus sp.]|uniref:VOC family protein n=1 Tax=uncultured Rhodoblastus sp. TaxID=543037 RepID=UPI0025CCBF9B|nr:VOC family protein [uncultured Rhodoblastus sp.]
MALAAGVVEIERILLTVSSLDRAEGFYRDGLGFETVGRGEMAGDGFAHLVGLRDGRARTLTMRLGREKVTFVKYDAPGKSYPADSASPDRWFQHFAIVVSDMDKAYARLQRVGFTPISSGGPVTLPPANGFVRAFKFRDPDGHPLELLYFPSGQGRRVWAEGGDRVFLGIDHSAIGVADTERSEAFYEKLLGMGVAYKAVNRGSTQESLDGTFGAVVQITGLRPPAETGPGVEFLEYRTPPTGRPAPVDTKSNDLAHVELAFTVDDLDGLVAKLREARAPFVSPDAVELGDGTYAAMVRDPDGHAILLVQTRR